MSPAFTGGRARAQFLPGMVGRFLAALRVPVTRSMTKAATHKRADLIVRVWVCPTAARRRLDEGIQLEVAR